MSNKAQLKNLKWLKEKTDEQNWWIVIEDETGKETMGFSLKPKASIKEAVKEILDEHEDDVVVQHLLPYSMAHTCPKCGTLIENDSIFEICDECKEEVTTRRNRINMSEDELRAEFDNKKKEALDYLQELKEKLTGTKPNGKLN